jgi:hypothetical protein
VTAHFRQTATRDASSYLPEVSATNGVVPWHTLSLRAHPRNLLQTFSLRTLPRKATFFCPQTRSTFATGSLLQR